MHVVSLALEFNYWTTGALGLQVRGKSYASFKPPKDMQSALRSNSINKLEPFPYPSAAVGYG